MLQAVTGLAVLMVMLLMQGCQKSEDSPAATGAATAVPGTIKSAPGSAQPALRQWGSIACNRCPGIVHYVLSTDGQLRLLASGIEGKFEHPVLPDQRISHIELGKDRDYLALLEQGGQRLHYTDQASHGFDRGNFGFSTIESPLDDVAIVAMRFLDSGALLLRLANAQWYQVARRNSSQPVRATPIELTQAVVPGDLIKIDSIPSLFAQAANPPPTDLIGKLNEPSADDWLHTMAYGLLADGAVVQWAYGSAAAGRRLDVPAITELVSTGYAVFGLGKDQRVYWLSADQTPRTYSEAECQQNRSQNPFCTQTAVRNDQDQYELVDAQARPVEIEGLPAICTLAGSVAIDCEGQAYRIETELIRHMANAFEFDSMGGLPLTARPSGIITKLTLASAIDHADAVPAWPVYLPGRATSATESLHFLGTDGRAYQLNGQSVELR